MAFVAKKIYLTKGVGKHRERLSSFELALRSAGIAACNIVRVSSIFPPNCKLISRAEGLKHLKPGQVAFTVISENSTREAHRLIAAGIGLALPADKSMYGYLSEHHSFGETEEVAGEYTEELAAEMLATTLERRIRSGFVLGREKRSLPHLQQNRPHHEHHPIRSRRQARPVDHRPSRRHHDRRRRLTHLSLPQSRLICSGNA
jgi:arginine decarboxylase